MQKMWDRLGSRLDLEPPVPMNGNTYLGLQQMDIETPSDVCKKQGEFIDSLLNLHSKPTELGTSAVRGVVETSTSSKNLTKHAQKMVLKKQEETLCMLGPIA